MSSLKSQSTITNIAFYKFVRLEDVEAKCTFFKTLCRKLSLKGTILLANEGINGMLAGDKKNTDAFVEALKGDSLFSDVLFKESESTSVPFKKLLVKVKSEIVTLRDPNGDPSNTAPYIKPEELEALLDQKDSNVVLIDVRNDFEVGYGTFKESINPKTKSFGQFPQFIEDQMSLLKDKKIVTFCTGGIRCEKATAYMRNRGLENVFQLHGGILEYFKRTEAKHFEGSCFVFDERESLDKKLNPKKSK